MMLHYTILLSNSRELESSYAKFIAKLINVCLYIYVYSHIGIDTLSVNTDDCRESYKNQDGQE